tara:strand:+ start:3739 stop:5898 length:2160 start_codon:yes stop_codon:yes gene_type:complete
MKLPIIIIFLSIINISFASEITSNISLDQFSESKAKNIFPNYNESPKEAKYYDNPQAIETDKITKANNDEVATLIKEKYNKSGKYEINSDEPWLNRFTDEDVKKIEQNYLDCERSNQQTSSNICSYNNEPVIKNCSPSRVVESQDNYIYSCFKDKQYYQKNCQQKLDLKCTNIGYSFPRIISNSLPGFRYEDNKIYYSTKRRMGQNCNGHKYSLSFHIDNVDQVEEFVHEYSGADDRTQVILNEIMVHNSPSRGCELSRYSKSWPNKNLKPFLKAGTNTLEIRVIVGGLGEGDGRFRIKYKNCLNYKESWNKICDENIGYDEDECVIENKICKDKDSIKDISNSNDSFFEKRDCWHYDIEESCTPKYHINYCNDLSLDNNCSQFSSSCLEENGNECLIYQNKYECISEHDIRSHLQEKVQFEKKSEKIINDFIDEESCEFGSHCNLVSEECISSDKDNKCNHYNRKYLCEDRDDAECQEEFKGCVLKESICSSKKDDICIEYQNIYDCKDKQENGSTLFCGSQKIESKKDQNFAKSAAILASLQDAGNQLDKEDLSIFTGSSQSCSKDMINLNDCCKVSGWGQNIGLDSCSASEKKLSVNRGNDLCQSIGSYCSKEHILTKICLKMSEVFCCFKSKISLIVHQQGRNQLNLGWGSSKNPNCRGFSASELQNIDFSKIDFSNLHQEFINNSNTPINQQSIINKINDYYQANDVDDYEGVK